MGFSEELCFFFVFESYISLSWLGWVYDGLDGWMAWCEYFIELHEWCLRDWVGGELKE